MDFLEDWNINFAMIHIIHKILVLIKNHMNYFFQEKIFFIIYNDEKSKVWRRKNKDIRNLLRLNKELNDTAIKDIRN